MSGLLKILFFLATCVCFSYESQSGHATNIDCKPYKKCYECIQISGCKWCADESGDFKNTTERCYHNEKKCNPNAVENPESKIQVKTDQDAKTDPNSKFVPSMQKIQMRKGGKLNISFVYHDEKNRPLDLYILMDLSCTMNKHKKTMETLTDTLVEKLKELTNDLKLGFGSFVDKPMTPYATKPARNANSNKSPSPSSSGACTGLVPSYSFKHHLSLVENATVFKNALHDATSSTNVDAPEGGFDALMQAIVCSDKIGWRTDNAMSMSSRRIIVFSTDATFHFAGDGKLGGILLPNDGECHMENNVYSSEKSTTTDYPSISQIKSKLEKHDIYVIFAVTSTYLQLYEKLANELKPLSTASAITQASSSKPDGKGSIVQVIQDEYKKLVGTVSLKARNSSPFTLRYFAKCKPNGDYEKRSNCTNLEPGSKIPFIVEIELNKCPQDKIFLQTLEIAPSLGSHDGFRIDVEVLCGCSCETNNKEANDGLCSNNGFKQCGICKCGQTWGGKYCQCSSNSTGGGQRNFQADCIKKDDSEPCSGNGHCKCGECHCIKNAKQSYSGTYCECDDFKCEKDALLDNGICNSGADQGKCGCDGKCECFRGYKGSRCQCPPDDKLKSGQENCQDPADKTMHCNGHGTCTCEEDTVKCKCDKGYTGDYCEVQSAKGSDCKTSIAKWQTCIRCMTLENPNQTDFNSYSRKTICEESKKCSLKKMNLEFVDRITSADIHPEVRGFEYDSSRDCRGSVEDEKGCSLFFIVGNRKIHSDVTDIYTEKIVNEANCPAGAIALYAIIGGVVGATLLIGILTLLVWKVLTHIHDKREYDRFEKDKSTAAWAQDDNPMYQAPVSEFKNPAYSDQ